MSGPKEETAIVADALKFLAFRFPGSKLWRANSGGGKTGHRCNSIDLVDIIGWAKFGMAIAIEVKTATGELSDHQCDFLNDIMVRGGYAGLYAPGILYDWGRIPARFMTPFQRKRYKHSED